jgi:hypothetical protein
MLIRNSNSSVVKCLTMAWRVIRRTWSMSNVSKLRISCSRSLGSGILSMC